MKIFLFLCLCLVSAAQATPVTTLFQGEVPIASQDKALRTQAIQTALQQVLVKVSGNTKVGDVAAVRQHLSQAEELVSQYDYVKEGEQLKLQVTFQAPAVTLLLQRAGQPIWGKDRPLLIAWISVADTTGEHLLNAETGQEKADFLIKSADARGLPISLPLLDLEDIKTISPKSIQNLDLNAIKAASKRYDPAGILVGKIEQVSQVRWTSQWTLLLNGEKTSWNEEADDFPSLTEVGIRDVADNMSTRFATVGETKGSFTTKIRVSRINSVDEYKKVLDYLQHLNGVQRVEVLKVEPRMVIYQIEAGARNEALMKAIASNAVLVPLAPEAVIAADGTLDYQYAL